MKLSKNAVIGGLIVLNLVIIMFFWLNKPQHPPGDPRTEIIEQLSLDSKQIQEFDKLIKVHRLKMVAYHDGIRKAKKAIYDNLLTGEDDEDSIFNILGRKHIAIEKYQIQHLLDIKKLLTEDQNPAYRKLLNHIERIFQPGPSHPPKP